MEVGRDLVGFAPRTPTALPRLLNRGKWGASPEEFQGLYGILMERVSNDTPSLSGRK